MKLGRLRWVGGVYEEFFEDANCIGKGLNVARVITPVEKLTKPFKTPPEFTKGNCSQQAKLRESNSNED